MFSLLNPSNLHCPWADAVPAKITPGKQPQRVNSFHEGVSVDAAVSVKMLAVYAYKAYRIFRR
jgi:hypothetical protein